MAVTNNCKQCHQELLTSSKRQLFCCDCRLSRNRAQKLAAKARRRARTRLLRASAIDPIEILERGNWTCYICHKPTPISKRGSYDHDAPEVDHIKPLSLGGAHISENLACICRRCNSIKGAKFQQPVEKTTKPMAPRYKQAVSPPAKVTRPFRESYKPGGV